MTRRDRLIQGAPTRLEADFPSCSPGESEWFRAHAWREKESDGGCWHYSSVQAPPDGRSGRFDLRYPQGTCYWASTEIAAVRERLGRPTSIVAHDEVEQARVSCARFDPGHIADLLHVDAARHGVIQELSSAAPYGLTQQWAQAFASTGFSGLRYQPRFSSEHAEALAVFGPAGRPDVVSEVQSGRPAADVLIDNGYTVLASPHSSELTLDPDPPSTHGRA